MAAGTARRVDGRRTAPAQVPPADGALDLDPLPGLIGYVLRRTHAAVFARFREVFADLDIRPVQLGILTVVGNNPGLKQAEVSAALGIKRTNLVPLLDGLASRGLIARTSPAADRRSRALVLTPAGASLLAEAHLRERLFEDGLARGIGETGRARLLDLLRAVEASCRKDEEPADAG